MTLRRDLLRGTFVVLAGLTVIGLLQAGQDDPPKKPAAKAKPAADDAKPGAEEKTAEAAKRDSLTGRWFLELALPNGQAFTIGLVEFKGEKDATKAELLQSHEQFVGLELNKSTVKDKDVDLVLEGENADFHVTGKLADGVIRGEVSLAGGARVFPALLAATEEKNMKTRRAPKGAEGGADFLKAVESEEFKDWEKWLAKYSNSPLAFYAYSQALGQLENAEVKAADAAKFGERFVASAAKWGKMLETQARLSLGTTFADSDDYQELALPYLEAVTRSDLPESIKSQAAVATVKLLIDTNKVKEGVALAEKTLQANPFTGELLIVLAQQAEKEKQTDRALDLYARIVSIPMMERMIVGQMQQSGELKPSQMPSTAVERLYTAKNGDTKGLEEFLDKAYEKTMAALVPQGQKLEKPKGNRVALFELFTGQACPPCVAADVSTGLLEQTFPATEAIVLRYHQHIPAPDPLCNADSENRFKAYEGQGTPTLVANGEKLSFGGFMAQVSERYQTLRDLTSKTRDEKSDVTIDVSAKAEGRQIAITAKAKATGKKLKLRLALAEEKIPFKAANGIRSHEMVVRSMPGGVDGVDAKEGQMTFTGTVNVDELKDTLEGELDQMEAQMARKFPAKPMDLQTFRLVAFVQDDDTGEVLQAKAVHVEGKLDAPKAATKPAKEDDKKSEKSKSE